MSREQSTQREQPREIDVSRVTSHLGNAFEKATSGMGRPISPWWKTKDSVRANEDFPEGNDLYKLQVEFCYLMDDITRGAKYIAPKIISECNEFIESIPKQRAVNQK